MDLRVDSTDLVFRLPWAYSFWASITVVVGQSIKDYFGGYGSRGVTD